MQRETGWQGFSSRGVYRIDEFQVLRLFERIIPGGVVFARLSTVRHPFRDGSSIRARRYNLNFHSNKTSVAFDASRGEPGDCLNIAPEICGAKGPNPQRWGHPFDD
jgi:hypothetical protein